MSIVEIRNQDAIATHPSDQNIAGSWTTNLQQKILIEDGDSIIVKQSYIDTASQTAKKIIIPADLNCEFDMIYYMVNYRGVDNLLDFNPKRSSQGDVSPEGSTILANDNQRIAVTATSDIKPKYPVTGVKNGTTGGGAATAVLAVSDGAKYLCCTENTGVQWETYNIKFTNISLVVVPSPNGASVFTLGGFKVQFSYIGIDGTPKLTIVTIAPHTLPYQSTTQLPATLNITYIKDNQNLLPGGQTVPLQFRYDPKLGGTSYTEWWVPSTDNNSAPAGLQNTYFSLLGTEGTKVAINDAVYTPYKQTKTFVVPKGTYAAIELTTTINRAITQIQPLDEDDRPILKPNPILFDLEPSDKKLNNFIKMAGRKSDKWIYGYEYQATSTWVGASLVELGYDDSTDKFVWNYLHTPIYEDGTAVAGPASVGCGYNAYLDLPDIRLICSPGPFNGLFNNGNTAVVVKAYSGILFTAMSSTRADTGENYNFFDKILGFDLKTHNIDPNTGTSTVNPNCIITSYTMGDGYGWLDDGQRFVFTGGPQVHIPYFPDHFPIAGKQFTEAFYGTDAQITKGNGTAAPANPAADSTPFYKPNAVIPPTGDDPPSITLDIDGLNWGELRANYISKFPTNFSTAQDTTGIIASTSVLSQSDPSLAFGYFLIEIGANFQNNYITPDARMGSIMSIVSRYYNVANYTSGSSDSSIAYTHKGASLLLTSFNCRILNSDKTPALGLGADNTIFLQIYKAPKPSPEQLALMAKLEKKKK